MLKKLPLSARRLVLAALALVTALGVGLVIRPALAATPFKVLAFYNGTWDAAHIDFDKEARHVVPARPPRRTASPGGDHRLEPAEHRQPGRSTRSSCSWTTRRRPPRSGPRSSST